MENYWSNTGENDLIRRLLKKIKQSTRNDIEQMINGGTILKFMHDDVLSDSLSRSSGEVCVCAPLSLKEKPNYKRQQAAGKTLFAAVFVWMYAVFCSFMGRWKKEMAASGCTRYKPACSRQLMFHEGFLCKRTFFCAPEDGMDIGSCDF